MSQLIFLNRNRNKEDEVIKIASKNLDKRRNYHLTIASCYLGENDKISDLISFIFKLTEYIKITTINFYIDARQVIKSGPASLKLNLLDALREDFGDENVQLYVVDTPTLFHSKALALVSENDESGICLVGSSNFSNSGLFSKNGNYESLIFTNSIQDVNEFFNSLNEIKKYIKKLDEFRKFKKKSYSFKYSILEQGYFIHKWQMTLQRFFSAQYKLTSYGKSEISFGEFEKLGFNVDSETVSKQFLNFEEFEERINTKYYSKISNLRRHGIETYLGHWIPKVLCPELDDIDLKNYTDELLAMIATQLEESGTSFDLEYEQLLNQDLIERNTLKPTQYILEKQNKLMGNEIRLERFLTKLEIFTLPYDFTQKDKIEDVFNILAGVSIESPRKNYSMKKILEAIESLDPEVINQIK